MVKIFSEFDFVDSGARPGSSYTMFAGSLPEDVAYTKVLWSSLSLQLSLEACLVSGDIKQRLRLPNLRGQSAAGFNVVTVSRPRKISNLNHLIEAHVQLKADEKARLLEKAKKREEILELINKQREERIQKACMPRDQQRG
ncbi:cilia- and flagella-associated protein HOATZ [Carcharodon carcharias]|uniref:cilia- and flagella-associated protein HOATZ n=1 Tax=Carcharodon carcharias TaxID=13397 RepID=UPI001B7DCD1E|nr:cilia- and flagella-associated protein HOATZ [Carcharodon carcharias]